MKLCIIFVIVISQAIIYCQGKPTVAATDSNPPAPERNKSNVRRSVSAVSQISDGLVGLVEYAKPFIVTYAAEYDKPSDPAKDDGIPFFEELAKQGIDGILIGTIKSSERSINFFIIFIFKLWSLKDTDKGKQLLSYLKIKYDLDMTRVFNILESKPKENDVIKVDAVDLANKADRCVEQYSADVIRAGDIIFGQLSSSVENAQSIKDSLSNILNGSRDMILAIGSQSISMSVKAFNSFMDTLPDEGKQKVKSALNAVGLMYSQGAIVSTAVSVMGTAGTSAASAVTSWANGAYNWWNGSGSAQEQKESDTTKSQ